MQMNKKRCVKYLIRIGVVLLLWWLGLQFYYHCIPPGSVIHFAKAMEARDADELKAHVVLPFDLKYPIPKIKTMEEFVEAIPWMVDEESLDVMSKFWEWEEIGWRGAYCSDAGVWMTVECPAELISFTSLTDAGYAYWEECVKRNIASLHPSLREGVDEPILSFRTADGAWRGRIDRLEEAFGSDVPSFTGRQKYRLAAYKKGTPLNGKPDAVVICNYRCEGSANNEYYSGVGSKFGLDNCHAGQLEDLGLWFCFPGSDGKVCCVKAEMCDWNPEQKN